MGYQEHREAACSLRARCAVITVSDTRTQESDRSGGRIKELLLQSGHDVAFYQVVGDEPGQLDGLLTELEGRGDIDVIVTNGGTGISPRDQTIPTVARHLTTLLPGFGELFRMLSFQEIQSGAMLSRAVGGIARGEKLLFALPGSPAAVELAMTHLIVPELKHLLSELRK